MRVSSTAKLLSTSGAAVQALLDLEKEGTQTKEKGRGFVLEEGGRCSVPLPCVEAVNTRYPDVDMARQAKTDNAVDICVTRAKRSKVGIESEP